MVRAPIRNPILCGNSLGGIGTMVLWRCTGDGTTALGVDPLDAWEKWVSERKYQQFMGPRRQC